MKSYHAPGVDRAMASWAESTVAACDITSFSFMPCKGCKKPSYIASSVTLASGGSPQFLEQNER